MLVDAKYGKVKLQNTPQSALDDIEEPVFVIRGQDDLALHAITRYRNALAGVKDIDAEKVAALDGVIGRFAQFREEHADRIKVTD
jgi:hypothetical protein